MQNRNELSFTEDLFRKSTWLLVKLWWFTSRKTSRCCGQKWKSIEAKNARKFVYFSNVFETIKMAAKAKTAVTLHMRFVRFGEAVLCWQVFVFGFGWNWLGVVTVIVSVDSNAHHLENGSRDNVDNGFWSVIYVAVKVCWLESNSC